MHPFLHLMTLSAMECASAPLTLITEIAPDPGTVAGAQIVSSFRMYISTRLIIAKLPQLEKKAKFYLGKSHKNIYIREVLRVLITLDYDPEFKEKNMCKHYHSGTCLEINYLSVDSQSCLFLETIVVDHYLH